jgi:simple sugar transport system permease protein
MAAGAFGDWPRFFASGEWSAVLRPWGEMGNKAALLTLTGLSVAVAFRVGLFNIGAQGQMMMGAITAAVLGAHVELPGGLHLIICVVGAALAGGAYASLAAWLKLKRGVHEVISTIMLNWVAVSLVENWWVTGPLRASASGDNSISGTDQVHPTAELPRLLGEASRLNLGFALAALFAFALYFWLTRTTRGFEWKAVGLSPSTAEASGIDVRRRTFEAFALAGVFAGMAGSVLVLGTELKYPATLAAPYGFDGIAMALLGQGNPLGVLFTALFFGGLRAGGTRMQLFGVHKSFPELIQGLALLFVAAKLAWEWLLTRRWRRA